MNPIKTSETNLNPTPQNCKLKIRDAFFSRHNFCLNPGQAWLTLQQAGNETNRALFQVHRGFEKFQSAVFPLGLRIKGLSLPGTN